MKKDSVEQRKRMEYLTDLLNRASEAYYARDTEIISNLEYMPYMMNCAHWRKRQA